MGKGHPRAPLGTGIDRQQQVSAIRLAERFQCIHPGNTGHEPARQAMRPAQQPRVINGDTLSLIALDKVIGRHIGNADAHGMALRQPGLLLSIRRDPPGQFRCQRCQPVLIGQLQNLRLRYGSAHGQDKSRCQNSTPAGAPSAHAVRAECAG